MMASITLFDVNRIYVHSTQTRKWNTSSGVTLSAPNHFVGRSWMDRWGSIAYDLTHALFNSKSSHWTKRLCNVSRSGQKKRLGVISLWSYYVIVLTKSLCVGLEVHTGSCFRGNEQICRLSGFKRPWCTKHIVADRKPHDFWCND